MPSTLVMKVLTMPAYTMKEHTMASYTMEEHSMPSHTMKDPAMPLHAMLCLSHTMMDPAMPLHTMLGLFTNKREEQEEDVGGGEQPKSCHVRPLASSPTRRCQWSRRAVHMCCLVP